MLIQQRHPIDVLALSLMSFTLFPPCMVKGFEKILASQKLKMLAWSRYSRKLFVNQGNKSSWPNFHKNPWIFIKYQ